MVGRILGIENVQLSPDHGYGQCSMIRGGVYHLVWVRVPAMSSAFFPEQRSIGIWTGDAEESEGGDGKGQFEGKQGDENLG